MWLKNSLGTPHKIPLSCSLERKTKSQQNPTKQNNQPAKKPNKKKKQPKPTNQQQHQKPHLC